MPIPTRAFSLREPTKQSSNIGRPATARTVTTPAPSDGGVPANAATGAENLSNRRKSLLPQRSNPVRGHDDANRPAGPLRSQSQEQQETKLQRVSRSQQLDGSEPTMATSRRQSLIRPTPLKTVSSAKPTAGVVSMTPTAKSAAFAVPPSPQKHNRPSSPKKTGMPPPPRLGRSASLRQNVTSTSSLGIPSVAPGGHNRHRSQIIVPASSQISKRSESQSSSSTTTTTTTATANSRLRGQFTTYQQQFSPKKMVKPPPAAPSVGASADPHPSLIPSSWPEIAALQTEVLQLNLLHSSSLQQNAEWEAASEAQLQRKYDSVAENYRALWRKEKGCQRRLNGQALNCWLQNSREHNGRQGFLEQIQVFSQVVQEVSDLSDCLEGRHTLVVQEFEAWFQKAEAIKKLRLYQEGDSDHHVVFINPLDRVWKEESYAMTMKLELCLRQLQSLDILGYGEMESLEDSALLRTAKGLDDMITLMVEELNAIRRVESDIIKSERLWVSQLTKQLTATQPRDERGTRVGMWR